MLESRSHSLQLAVKVFCVSTLVYLTTWGGHYTTGDGAHKIAWAKVMLWGPGASSGTPSGGVYSKYGIGHSLLAMTPLIISTLVHKAAGIRCEAALYTLMFVLNGALLLGLITYYLAQFYETGRVIRTVALIGFATIWWPYTKLDFSEPLVATLFFAGFILMRFGRPTIGMAIAATSLTVRTDSAILLAALALWYIGQHRRLDVAAKLSLACLPSIAVVAASNYARYHAVFDRGYAGETFSTPLFVGLYGILFSAGKSIFLFSPPLLAGVFAWRKFRRGAATRYDALLFACISVLQAGMYALWWDWSSDDAWGIRFMLLTSVLMCIPVVEVVHRQRIFVPAAVAGIAVQILAVTPGPLDYLMLLRSQPSSRQALFFGNETRVDFEDIRFNPRYGQLAGNWILLRELLCLPPTRKSDQGALSTGTPLFDILPPNAWKDAAHWDFIWARGHQ